MEDLNAIRSDQLFLAHIRDSQAYLLREGELHQVGKAHNWVGDAVGQGVITQAICLDQQPQADTYVMPLTEIDLLLLCPDGLNSMIPDAEINRILTGSSRKL